MNDINQIYPILVALLIQYLQDCCILIILQVTVF